MGGSTPKESSIGIGILTALTIDRLRKVTIDQFGAFKQSNQTPILFLSYICIFCGS